MSYTVHVDDNFHYQDESERYTAGSYETYDRAVAECRKIVDRSLTELFTRGMSADELMKQYAMFGEDPWISGDSGDDRFPARDYARGKCAEMCG